MTTQSPESMPPPAPTPTPPLALWGGHECTVNRVGDRWFDQTVRSGHEHRLDDLSLFADLGIASLRYPALWERIAPDHPDQRDFAWTDERLPEIRRLGMTPILTLCHHGSGPHYTSLLDDTGFATGLAHHAAAVAARYPWVEDYTPVNEPLTTARFSALYGFWYPHARDETAFWRALLNETDATRLAMRAIRRVNPAARLIQTDDLGYCHASPPLRAAADFQNERRWMGWDLLCGMVVPGHALWDRLVEQGFEARLRTIADDPCPPDVIGVNHYLSSERLLDHRIDLHDERAPADRAVGETDGVAHVDVDAARSHPTLGIARLIEQAWDRYRIPIAVTECHLGTTREDQARWFVDVWREAEGLRARGVDLCAVTAWSLLGAYDWDRMVTHFVGHYEPGVFDLRDGTPRATAMVRVLRQLAAGETPDMPGLTVPGWWREPRTDRTFAVPADAPAGDHAVLMIVTGDDTLSWLITTTHHALTDDIGSARMLRPWVVLDTRPGTNDPSLIGVCADLGIGAAIFARRATLESTDLLIVETARIFTADDEGAIEIAMLDGARGTVRFDPIEPVAAAEFARLLGTVAGHAQPADGGASDRSSISHLPVIKTVLERFVTDRRRFRATCITACRASPSDDYLAAAE